MNDKLKELEANADNANLSGEYTRFLEFDLGDEHYAVPLLSIREVIPVPETTHLPNAPVHFVGIMNLRGQIISVIDLRKRLNIKPKEENSEESVVIVDFADISIGLVVDSINKVLNFPLSEVSEIPEISAHTNAKYIQGVYRGEDHLSILLDLANILNINEIKNITNKAA